MFNLYFLFGLVARVLDSHINLANLYFISEKLIHLHDAQFPFLLSIFYSNNNNNNNDK